MPSNPFKDGGRLHGRNQHGFRRRRPRHQRPQQAQHHGLHRLFVRVEAVGHGGELRPDDGQQERRPEAFSDVLPLIEIDNKDKSLN